MWESLWQTILDAIDREEKEQQPIPTLGESQRQAQDEGFAFPMKVPTAPPSTMTVNGIPVGGAPPIQAAPQPSPTPTPTQAPLPTPTPPIPSHQRNESTDAFLDDRILPVTRDYNIPDALVAGQFAGEGRTAGLGASRNNYFNLGAYDADLDNTFQYDTPEEGFDAYARLLTEDARYKDILQEYQDPADVLRRIAPIYASRPDYADFIMNTPEWRRYYNP